MIISEDQNTIILDVFTYKAICVNNFDCDGCSILGSNLEKYHYCDGVPCIPNLRKDQKNVIFKQVQP